jgi:hypothetical protein
LHSSHAPLAYGFTRTIHSSHSCETLMMGPVRRTETLVNFNHRCPTIIQSAILRLLSMCSLDYKNQKVNRTNELMDNSFCAVCTRWYPKYSGLVPQFIQQLRSREAPVSTHQTVNSGFYCDVLRRLRENVGRRRPEVW